MYKKNEKEKIKKLLENITIPETYQIKQKLKQEKIDNISEEINYQFYKNEFYSELISRIKDKRKIGIAVGSRGIANLDKIVKSLVDCLIQFKNIDVIIIPAMGSHGGATADGQKDILAEYGITEEKMGVPIIKNMDTVILTNIDGEAVYWDKMAASLDAVVLINRVKPHTSFRHNVESGLFKIASIGLGNQTGAAAIHKAGFKTLGDRIEKIGRYIFNQGNILFGVAILENAFDETQSIHFIFPENIPTVEPQLLKLAKKNIPQIPFENADVLIVNEIGKNYSGPGADPNVTGRFASGIHSTGFQTTSLAFLNLSYESHGNANGLGVADVVTQSLVSQMDLVAGYTNTLTSTLSENAKIPMIMPDEELAIKAAIKFSHQTNLEQLKLIRIKNTLELETMEISRALLREAAKKDNIEIITGPEKMLFKNRRGL